MVVHRLSRHDAEMDCHIYCFSIVCVHMAGSQYETQSHRRSLELIQDLADGSDASITMDDFDDMDALTAPASGPGDERPPLTFEAALHQDYDSDDDTDDGDDEVQVRECFVE